MAFQIKYSKKFQRIGVTATYRVDILSEAGDGVITPYKMGADPFQLKSLGSEKDEDKVVIGSEIAFEFVLNKHIGESDYDAIFESEYRDHIVKFYNDDTSTLLWQGYLQPENMYKSVFESNLHIYFSASDALKDLSDYEFLSGGAIVTGRLSGLAILKLCLTNLDQDSQFQYNFLVKLGTKPDGMVNDDHNALLYVTHDCRRFSKVENGKTVIDNCLTVIEKVLTPYSCQLFQWGGKYYIKNRHEGDSHYYTYNWALVLQGNRAASADVVNIDTLKFKRDAEQSLLAPVKKIGIRLLNRNLGEELVSDINDYSALGPWNFTGFPDPGDVTDETDQLHILINNTNEGEARNITLSDDVALTKVTDNDYIKLKFDIRASDPGIYNTSSFIVEIIKPDGTYTQWEQSISTVWQIYESPNNEVFRITQSGDYNINIKFFQSIGLIPPYQEDVWLRNFSLTKILSIDDNTYSDISFDIFYKAISDQGKKIKPDKDVFFGDTIGTNDLAALVYDGSNTDKWDRVTGGDDKPLLELYCLNYLTNRKAYSKYLMLTVKDAADSITPVNYITFGGDTYDIVSFDKSYRFSWVTLHLKQRLTGDITLAFNEIIMNSIDGEKMTNDSLIVTADSGFPGAGIALSSGAGWGVSIANNSANWNTAYGWGNHAGLYISDPGTSVDREILTWADVNGNAVRVSTGVTIAADYSVLASGDLVAYQSGAYSGSIWDSIPVTKSVVYTGGYVQLNGDETTPTDGKYYGKVGGVKGWYTPSGGVASYPGAGIALSTGFSWGTSYTTSGSGTVLALTDSPTFTGNVIISKLSFNAATGSKINFYDNGSIDYGIGIQNNLLQLYCDTNTDRVGIGYGRTGSFTETLTVKGGKVGVGIIDPDFLLTVGGDATAASAIVSINGPENQQKGLVLSSAGTTKWYMYNPASSTDLKWFNGTADKLTLSTAGTLTAVGDVVAYAT